LQIQVQAFTRFVKMKVKVIARSEEDFTRERSQDLQVRS